MMIEKPLLIVDCDGPLADSQYLVDHICMHLGLPRIDVRTSLHFQICHALGCENELVEIGFTRSKSTFSSDSYHPLWESVEAIETLSLYYDWAIGTARSQGGKFTTKRWSTRVYCRPGAEESVVYHAQGQGNLFGHLREGETKLELCNRLGAYAIIEDNPHEIRHFAISETETIPICVAYPYNKSIATEFPDVFRDDWPQIVQFLLAKRG